MPNTVEANMNAGYARWDPTRRLSASEAVTNCRLSQNVYFVEESRHPIHSSIASSASSPEFHQDTIPKPDSAIVACASRQKLPLSFTLTGNWQLELTMIL